MCAHSMYKGKVRLVRKKRSSIEGAIKDPLVIKSKRDLNALPKSSTHEKVKAIINLVALNALIFNGSSAELGDCVRSRFSDPST